MTDKPPRAASFRFRLLGAGGIAIILAGWAIASLAAGSYFVPAPWTTFADTALLLARPFTWTQILTTLLRVGAGFLGGFAAGAAAGIAMGANRDLDALFKPLVLFFQGMPPLLWAIPLVALMGIGHLPAIMVIGLITFPLVSVTVGEGMSTLPRAYREMLTLFAPGFIPRMRELVLPYLAPFLAAGVKAGLVLAVKASVTAEYFGANDGIGFQIQAAYMSMRIRSLFSWAAVLILIILVFNHLLPRIRLAGPVLHGLVVRRSLPRIEPQDIVELERSFTSRAGSSRIVLKDVSAAYGKQTEILRGVNLAIIPNEIAVVTGESGIGKTTLLKVAAGLLKPAEGSVSCPPRVGFVFQDDRLLPWRSIEQNTALPLFYQGFKEKSATGFARYLLAEAGLAGEEEKRPDELSGGMKKRAALARCFARLPDAIFLDEPFSGLHAEARGLLWDMFLRLLTLHPVPALIVTHYPQEISSLASCTMYVLEGKPAQIAAVKR